MKCMPLIRLLAFVIAIGYLGSAQAQSSVSPTDLEEPTTIVVQAGCWGRIKDTSSVWYVSAPSAVAMQQAYPNADRHALYVWFRKEISVHLGQSSDAMPMTGLAQVDSINAHYGCKAIGLLYQNSYVFAYRNAIDIVEARKRLMATGLFTEIEYNEIIEIKGGGSTFIPNDTRYPLQWGLNNDSISISNDQFVDAKIGADIRMEAAWDCEQGDTSIIVAIIDTGCNTDHPELTNRVWMNYGEIPGNQIDDDGNGFVDDIQGWDFKNRDNSPEDIDAGGHGTGISGIIGAESNNGFGLSGVDRNCKLMVVKFTNQISGSITVGVLDSAIRYAVNNGADVINFSYTFTANSGIIRNAILSARDRGVIFVTIAGNEGDNGDIFYPGAYPDSLGIVVVGSTDPDDERSLFFVNTAGGSNYTANMDVVAPGNYIYVLSNLSDTTYNVVGGTSAAAPHVAGLAALLKARYPGLAADSIVSIIQQSADDQVGNILEDTPGFDIYHGYGRINAERALCGANAVRDVVDTKASLSVFPNPSMGWVNARLANVTIKSAKVSIYDAHGQPMTVRNFSGAQEIAFDLPATNGLYMVEVIVNDRLRSVAKVLRIE